MSDASCSCSAPTLSSGGTNPHCLLLARVGTGAVAQNSSSKTPRQVGTHQDWITGQAGKNHACGMRGDGQNNTIWCWGQGNYGQLGQGNYVSGSDPLQAGADSDWTALSIGYEHNCGIRQGGSLWCWGRNNLGQLGDGTTATRTSPVAIASGTQWSSVHAGTNHTCAITTGNSLFCWGNNSYGTVGNGSAGAAVTLPTQVGTDADWASLSGDAWDTCATKTDGSLWCWGRNSNGSHGLGHSIPSSTPQPVGTDADWNTHAIGYGHACAIKTDGRGFCVGSGTYGKVGVGSETTLSSLTEFAPQHKWLQLQAGPNQTCGITDAGKLYCWGRSDYGQLGLTSAWPDEPQFVVDP